MSSRRWPRLVVLLLLLAAAFFPSPRSAAADVLTVQVDAKLDVTPAGDRVARFEIVWGPVAYPEIKAKNPDARKFLQDMAPDRAAYEMRNTSARYDDARNSVVMEMTEIAAARNRGGGRWELEPEPTATLDHVSPEGAPRATAWFKVKGEWGENLHYEGDYVCSLPAGATEARWDQDTKVLSWRLESPTAAGQPRLTADLRVRDRVMSTVYKVYGLESDKNTFWLAKTVFKNEGKGVAHRLKIRYRLQDYGDWSPWEKHPEVVPGQTIVSVHYPVLSAAIARLRTNTPANLLMEYVYEDDSGRRIEDDEAKKLVILGVNEFVFGNLAAGQSFGTWQEEYNNAALLAAWVSRNDGAVKQFAAMANRMAGGVGASTDDASAMRVLKACYELLQRNDFTYQHPPALKDRSVSFDPHDVQNVKFPRETLRDRSGTCIDLAILYAAMVNAVGLEPHLALIPGHCFPLVKLPSGRVVGVETTGVQGGLRVGSAPFARVQPYGDEEYDKANKSGLIYEIDVRSLWTSGISNPELDELPPDILERWGITEEGRAGRTPTRPDGATPTPPDDGRPTTSVDPDSAVGLWGGAIGTRDGGVTIESFVLGIDKKGAGYEAATRADLTVSSSGAADKKLVIITEYTGEAKPEGILFQSTSRTRAVDGGAPVTLVQAFLVVKPKGGHVEARVGNEAEGFTDFTLIPKERGESAASKLVRGDWGGEMPHGKLSENVILDELYVTVPAEGEYAADVRMECTVLKDGQKIPVTVIANYRDGKASGDDVRFAIVPWHRTVPATGQKTEIEGNPLVLHVTAEGKLAGQFEGDDGWPFTLLRRESPEIQKIRGAWGGEMPHGNIESNVTLDEMYVDVPADGVLEPTIRLEVTIAQGGQKFPSTLVATYTGGTVGGAEVRFGPTVWKRTVKSTGQKSDVKAQAFTLRVNDEGKLAGTFEGDGGWPFTLFRRDGNATTPVTPTAPTPPADMSDLAGAWGGGFSDAKLKDDLFIREGLLDISKKPYSAEWTAKVNLTFVVKTPTGDMLVKAAGTYPPGRLDGDAIKFPGTSLTRTIVSTGATNPMDGNPLELRREPDGRLEVKFVGEGGFTLTMARR